MCAQANGFGNNSQFKNVPTPSCDKNILISVHFISLFINSKEKSITFSSKSHENMDHRYMFNLAF